MEVEKGHHGQRKAIDADADARRCRNQKENRNERGGSRFVSRKEGHAEERPAGIAACARIKRVA